MDPERFASLKAIYEQIQKDLNGPITDEYRQLYDTFLEAFPGAYNIWIKYINEELKVPEQNYENVEKIFYRCLPNVPNVELFNVYLKYIRQYKPDLQIEDVVASYDYALDKIGLDIEACPIYSEFIDFLNKNKNHPSCELDKCRKVFHKAFLVPMTGLPKLSADYHEFEKERAPHVSASLFKEWDAHVKTTKQAYAEKFIISQRLNTTDFFEVGADLLSIMFYWRFFIMKEGQNDVHVKPEQLHAFIEYAYRKSLGPLRYQWIIWHDFAQYYLSYHNDAAAIRTYAEAVRILPHNLMLSFAYAELLESRKKVSEALPVYRNIIANSLTKSDKTLSEIQLLKFLQRTEGPDAMRREFVIAFEQKDFTYHLLIAAAEIENAVNLDTESAKNILHKGLEIYSNDAAYIEEFVSHAIKLNDIEGLIDVYNFVVLLSKEKRMELTWTLLDFFRLAYDKSGGLSSSLSRHVKEISGHLSEYKEQRYYQTNEGFRKTLDHIKDFIPTLAYCEKNINLVFEFALSTHGDDFENCVKNELKDEEFSGDFVRRTIESFVNSHSMKDLDQAITLFRIIDNAIQIIRHIMDQIDEIITRIENDILTQDKTITRERLKLRSFFLKEGVIY